MPSAGARSCWRARGLPRGPFWLLWPPTGRPMATITASARWRWPRPSSGWAGIPTCGSRTTPLSWRATRRSIRWSWSSPAPGAVSTASSGGAPTAAAGFGRRPARRGARRSGERSTGWGGGAARARYAASGLPSHLPVRARELLEMERSALRMFTSCGWFFDDVAGLESIVCLRYAARAIQYSGSAPELEAALRQRLALAQSNDPAQGTARDVYDRALPSHPGEVRAAAAYAALRALAPP